MMERICIYNRCSTEEENQKNALEIQAQESVEIVRQHTGWQIVDQFVESQSGTTSAKRSKYQQLQKISYELDELKVEMSGVEDMGKRLLAIKHELKQGGVLKEALKAEVTDKVQKIRVHEDRMMDICFDKYKVAVCENGVTDEADLYTVSIPYEYVYEGDKRLAELREGIKAYITAKEKVTVKEIMEIFDVSQSRAYSRLRELKAEGIVGYERNSQGGYWYLVK